MSSKIFQSTSVAAWTVALCLSTSLGLAQTPPLHDPANLEVLKTFTGQKSLSDADIKAVREAMLKINNEARLNPEYRKLKGLKADLTLPAGLAPLVLNDTLNAAAQERAEERAGARRLPAGKAIPGLMATGFSSDLSSFPVGWQSSEQTHRPTWNLGGIPVDSVGYGVAKNSQNGQWAIVAIWADLEGAAAKDLGLHNPAYIKELATLSGKDKLTPHSLQLLRVTMLRLNNEARANPEYRKKVGGATLDLDLPANLSPLVLDDAANNAAQEQAEYQAANGTMTHENRNYRDFGARMDHATVAGGLEACGVSSNLQDFPAGWMKSDTHYRPTWNLVDPVDRVGYGAAKDPRTGQWYATAVWVQVDKNAKPLAVEAIAPPAAAPTSPPNPATPAVAATPTSPAATPAPVAAAGPFPAGLKTIDGKVPAGITMDPISEETRHDPFGIKLPSLRKGAILYTGQTLWAQGGHVYRLVITDAGAVAVADDKGVIKWSAGTGGTHVEYQATDGNFCLYDDAKAWKWGSQTYGPAIVNGQVRVNKDGVLEQLDDAGKVVWSSR